MTLTIRHWMLGFVISCLLAFVSDIVLLPLILRNLSSEFAMFMSLILPVPLAFRIVFVALYTLPFLIVNGIALLAVWRRNPALATGIRWGFLLALIVFGLHMRPVLAHKRGQSAIEQSYRGVELADASICERIEATDNIAEISRANCFAGVAEKKQDASLCDRIPEGVTQWSRDALGSTRYYCYLNIAVATNTPSLCGKFEDPAPCKSAIMQRWGE